MKIRDLYSDGSKWTKGAFARDKDGHALLEVCRRISDAQCYCLVGAIRYCYLYEEAEIRTKIRKHLNIFYINEWNDEPLRTFAEVKALVEVLDI